MVRSRLGAGPVRAVVLKAWSGVGRRSGNLRAAVRARLRCRIDRATSWGSKAKARTLLTGPAGSWPAGRAKGRPAAGPPPLISSRACTRACRMSLTPVASHLRYDECWHGALVPRVWYGRTDTISRSTIGPDQPDEETPNPYAVSTLAKSEAYAKRFVPSHVFAGNRGISGAKTVRNGRWVRLSHWDLHEVKTTNLLKHGEQSETIIK